MRAQLRGRGHAHVARDFFLVEVAEAHRLQHARVLSGQPHLAHIGGGVRLSRGRGAGCVKRARVELVVVGLLLLPVVEAG